MDAVIFDMDGLMLDTEPLAARAWGTAAAELGIAFDDAVAPSLIGRNFADCEMLIRAHHGETYPVAALMQAWHVAYDAIVQQDGITLKDGLVELLDWLDTRGVQKAVATSTRRSRALAKLAHTRLASRFATVVGGDEVCRGKPAPDIFLEAAARLDVAPAGCLVLEDSTPGVHAALAGGMTAIMVPDLMPATDAIRAANVLVLPSLHAVREHLAGGGGVSRPGAALVR